MECAAAKQTGSFRILRCLISFPCFAVLCAFALGIDPILSAKSQRTAKHAKGYHTLQVSNAR